MISVIIPALNEEKKIGECLLSLKNQSYQRFEVIVIDGGSEDRTKEISEKYDAIVIDQRSETIGGARREGSLHARGNVLAFTDADTIADPNWLRCIARNVQRYDLSLGPVYFYENNFRAALVQFWRRAYAIERLYGFYRIIGPNMAIKKSTYLRIEGHSDISLLEDYDFSEKIYKKKGIKRIYDKNQTVYTSARRMEKLWPYLWLYAYGHYHYRVTRDLKKLCKYPPIRT